MTQASGSLAAYRVLDLTDARGILCGKILADLGADVVRVEPPAGNPARRLQRIGIPAGVVQCCADLHRDPQLAARGAFQWLDHPEIGRAPYEAWPFRFSRTSGRLRRAPCLGEHTHQVLGELLAMSGEQVDRLITEGVLR